MASGLERSATPLGIDGACPTGPPFSGDPLGTPGSVESARRFTSRPVDALGPRRVPDSRPRGRVAVCHLTAGAG